MAYVIRYCAGFQFKVGPRKIWNVQGASNLEELRDRTVGLTLRRLKENVLDLPDKIITPVYLRLKSKVYEEVMGDYYNWYEKNPEESKSLTVQFTKLTKVRQIIADEKIAQTIEIAENIIEQDKKVIIFCNFTDSLNKITEHFGKAAVKLDGSMSKVERQFSVDQFQENDKIKVFVGNLKAEGVGITLTAARRLIMLQRPWSLVDHKQALDRVHRIGSEIHDSIMITDYVTEGTIEERVIQVLETKADNFEQIVRDKAQLLSLLKDDKAGKL
jgi:SWI/SNF-related matrix-associated actin-dependent regulator 1 of chromatin subfamily A